MAKDGHEDRFLYEDMAEDLLERIDFMQLDPGKALVIGSEGTELVDRLRADGWDVTVPDPCLFDEEQPWPAPFDLIISTGRMDRVNDLPGALLHMHHALAKGGIAIAMFVAAGSLPHLRQALLDADGERPAARMHPMVDNRAAAALMQRAGFARQVVDSRVLEVRYGSIDRLVADLRAHGLAGQLVSAPPPLTRKSWDRARKSFIEGADRDGKVTERFEILALTGWR